MPPTRDEFMAGLRREKARRDRAMRDFKSDVQQQDGYKSEYVCGIKVMLGGNNHDGYDRPPHTRTIRR